MHTHFTDTTSTTSLTNLWPTLQKKRYAVYKVILKGESFFLSLMTKKTDYFAGYDKLSLLFTTQTRVL